MSFRRLMSSHFQFTLLRSKPLHLSSFVPAQVQMFSEGDIGVLPPLGVYDPLGLIETRDMRPNWVGCVFFLKAEAACSISWMCFFFSHNSGWGSSMSHDYDNIKQDLAIINYYRFIRQFWIGRARYEYDQVDMRLWRSSTAARRCLASSTSSPSRLESGSRATSPCRRTSSSPTCPRVASRRSRPFLPPDGSRSWSWCFDVVWIHDLFNAIDNSISYIAL